MWGNELSIILLFSIHTYKLLEYEVVFLLKIQKAHIQLHKNPILGIHPVSILNVNVKIKYRIVITTLLVMAKIQEELKYLPISEWLNECRYRHTVIEAI